MNNPFDDPDGTYVVLRNDELQYSLWPQSLEVPGGWTVVHPAAGRQECLDYVEATWTDMRPRSLVERMNADGGSRPVA
jgi:MbtH protein